MNDVQNSILAIQKVVPSGIDNILLDTLTHDLWLRGVTFNDFTDSTYGPTGWRMLQNGQAPDVAGTAGGSTDPFTRYFKCTFDSAASQAGIVHYLNQYTSKALRGKTVSLSADLWGTAVANMRMAVLEWAGTADAPTSDVVGTWATGNPTLATNWSYIGTPASIAISSTRTRYKVENIAISSTANNIAVFIWTPDSEASTDVFNVAMVKLEEGALASPFRARDWAHELVLMQQIYEKSYNPTVVPGTSGANGYFAMPVPSNTVAANQYLGSLQFKTAKQKTPAVVVYGFSGTANTISNAGGTDLAANSGIAVGVGQMGSPVYQNSGGSVTTTATSALYQYTADAGF